jgi:hypothetical protein
MASLPICGQICLTLTPSMVCGGTPLEQREQNLGATAILLAQEELDVWDGGWHPRRTP